MDTKSKNIRYSGWFKLLAVVLGLAGVAVSFFGLLKAPDFEYGIQNDVYENSNIFSSEISGIRSDISNLWYAGVLFPEQPKSSPDAAASASYSDSAALGASDSSSDTVTEFTISVGSSSSTDVDASWLKSMKSSLESRKGLHYSVIYNGSTYGLATSEYGKLGWSNSTEDGTVTIRIGFDKDTFKAAEAEFTARRLNGLYGLGMFFGGLLLSLLSMFWLMYAAGRSRREDGIRLNTLDRVYLDIGFCIAAAIFGILVSLDFSLADNQFGGYIYNSQDFQQLNFPLFSVVMISLLSAAYLVAVLYAVSFAKRFKRHEVISHSLIGKICLAFMRYARNLRRDIKAGLDAGPITRKAAIWILIYSLGGGGICLLAAIISFSTGSPFFGFIVTLAVYVLVTVIAIRFVSKRLAGYKALSEGVRKIRDGALSYKIPFCGSQSIDSVSADINNLSQGLKAAVDNELMAERMKVELITNVSHDLRTPLTSIITYADLISADSVTPAQVKEYSEILKAKSDKLKHLVDDLFEVSKAESGTMSLDMEALNLKDLLTQTMAEYQDGLDGSRLEVKLSLPADKVVILADGSRMWRVLSNIFSNIVKYSMPGTRVYVDVEGKSENSSDSAAQVATITFRNISGSPMNFNSNEMFERFRRGDESRSSDGSGLGLAIVRSFMDIQKGSCSITTDGDLFKLKLTIPLAQKE
ncbi:MAG: HAMP domain-containing histidine kinase [Clostridiales bacterium]|nr:HAMP domain-containing histidine kinase [Clostridiales bacterium]